MDEHLPEIKGRSPPRPRPPVSPVSPHLPRWRPALTAAQPLHPVVDDGAVMPLVLQAPGGEALDGLHRVGHRLQLPVERGLQRAGRGGGGGGRGGGGGGPAAASAARRHLPALLAQPGRADGGGAALPAHALGLGGARAAAPRDAAGPAAAGRGMRRP